jgi:hypothetical protein
MSTEPDHLFNKRCIDTQLVFVLFPKKCYISGKKLWLELAYKRTALWTGPGDPILEHRYYDKTEYLIEKIKSL